MSFNDILIPLLTSNGWVWKMCYPAIQGYGMQDLYCPTWNSEIKMTIQANALCSLRLHRACKVILSHLQDLHANLKVVSDKNILLPETFICMIES
jgi:hypothetical protein